MTNEEYSNLTGQEDKTPKSSLVYTGPDYSEIRVEPLQEGLTDRARHRDFVFKCFGYEGLLALL